MDENEKVEEIEVERENWKDRLQAILLIGGILVAYGGVCYATIKLQAKVTAKEVSKLLR